MSPRHFARAFLAETGMTPAKAIEHLRLEAARAYVEDSGDPIDHVAELTGFRDPERMRRAFIRALASRRSRCGARQGLDDSLVCSRPCRRCGRRPAPAPSATRAEHHQGSMPQAPEQPFVSVYFESVRPSSPPLPVERVVPAVGYPAIRANSGEGVSGR